MVIPTEKKFLCWMESKKIILHLDLDCFFLQVEQNRNPVLRNEPLLAVQQHDDLICVSYEARKIGIKKHMKPKEAMEISKNKIRFVHVEHWPGTSKVTYRSYRKASFQIFKCIIEGLEFLCPNKNLFILEKNSIDEAYLDISNFVDQISDSLLDDWSSFETRDVENIAMKESPTDSRILLACKLAHFLRKRVKQQLHYDISIGIGPTKLIAKLASQRNKPKHQTLIYQTRDISILFAQTKWEQIPNFGKLFSDHDQLLIILHQQLQCYYCGELQNLNRKKLEQHLNVETSALLIAISQGIWEEDVVATGPSQSLMVSMTLTPIDKEIGIKRVIHFLVLEFMERIEDDFKQNHRICTNLHFRFRLDQGNEESFSIFSSTVHQKLLQFINGKLDDSTVEQFQYQLVDKCWNDMKKKHEGEKWKLRWIGLHVSTFEGIDEKQSSLQFVKNSPSKTTTNSVSQTSITKNKFTKEDNKWEIICPVCGKWLLKENATFHVNEHFLSEHDDAVVQTMKQQNSSLNHSSIAQNRRPQQGNLDKFVAKKKRKL